MPASTESLDPDLELAAEFPAASEDDWRSLVAAVLRKAGLAADADPIEALSTTTYDGIAIRPLYTSGPAPAVPRVPHGGAWDVRTWHRDPDASATNTAVLNDLETGATSLWLGLGQGGLAIDQLGTALDGVLLDLAPVALDAGGDVVDAGRALLELAGSADVRGSLGADPIGWRARTGAEVFPLAAAADLARPHGQLRVATVDATIYHDAGASDATEIAVATAVGVAYLRELNDAGLSAEEALSRIDFRFAVTADQFASIAKLRAARQLWRRVAELCGVDDAPQYQHAVTSAAMMTRRDPWVNMLRTTIACFAAAVGGADSVTVLPFDSAIGLPDDFARRIARNTHAVLHDESSVGRVVDAAGGSWYVETFTADLAQQAWDEFTAIERGGGALAALDDGTISASVGATRAARADDIAHRRAPITGVSEFAFPDEEPVSRNDAPAAPSGGVLEPMRWAVGFEGVRDEVEVLEPRPAVFLAALGPFAQHSARVSFATNLFNAGGFHSVVGTVDEFGDSGAIVACVCSSDTVYEDAAADTVEALRQAGAKQIWLAGTFDAGADGTLHAGCDALDVLRRTLEAVR